MPTYACRPSVAASSPGTYCAVGLEWRGGAVPGLAAGGAASAAAGFGLFTALLCGVSLVTLRVVDA
uniref:Uncharacterized protein n=1 Tax=Oryza brachyantha TaxID=4533 RepID=J3MQX8_ORYBR